MNLNEQRATSGQRLTLAWLVGGLGAAMLLTGGPLGCTFKVSPKRAAMFVASSPETGPVHAWILKHAISDGPYKYFTRRVGDLFEGAWVIGLGEATHGQSEAFDFKRVQTMHAVEHQGCRVVAYEASAASAMACDDYIAGRSNDLNAAMKGFGMLIWQVKENRELLQDLRRWNSRAGAADKVRFIGIDIQDPQGAIAKLREVLPAENASLIDAAEQLSERAYAAARVLRTGDSQPMDAVKADLERWGASVEAVSGLSPSASLRRSLCRMEIEAGLTMSSSPGARDRAMASMLLAQMQGVNASHPMVVWAHNAHVMHAPLRYLGEAGEREQAMGGHLRDALGTKFVAVGLAFGSGSFNALDRNGDRWEFREYEVGDPRWRSLDGMLTSVNMRKFALDLRVNVDEPNVSPRVREWMDGGQGQRWFGGYNVHIDESLPLLPTYPRRDYDVLIYLRQTSPSKPLNRTP